MDCVIGAPVATATIKTNVPAEIKVERIHAPSQSFPVSVSAGAVERIMSLGGSSLSAIPEPYQTYEGSK